MVCSVIKLSWWEPKITKRLFLFMSNPEVLSNIQTIPSLRTPEKASSPILPINEHIPEISQSLAENTVTVISAPTGSGKTTQIPQIAHHTGLFSQVIVTQPRIAPARELCERVSSEIGPSCSVGYYTSREKSIGNQKEQDIAFLTDGKIAAQLLVTQPDKTLKDKKTLLIIDEVHEWNKQTELLVAIAADRTNPNSANYDPNLSIVIMSATLNSDELLTHFKHTGPKKIDIEGRTFPVESRFLPSTSVQDTIHQINQKSTSPPTIVAKLPGLGEIAATSADLKRDGLTLPIKHLHGQQTKAQQTKVLRSKDTGSVILATNISQTSLTIPGVTHVVDSGIERVNQVDYLSGLGISCLMLQHTSRDGIIQMQGRTGRTNPGTYYLVSYDGKNRSPALHQRPKTKTPEIQRARLDDFVLRFVIAGEDIKSYPFVHPPTDESIAVSYERLKNLGALDELGQPTLRGRKMSKLPVEPEYACMLIAAQEQRLQDQDMQSIIDIVSIMQNGGVVERSPKKLNWQGLLTPDDPDRSKENQSDLFAQLEVFAKLVNEIPENEWSSYDIRENAIELIKRDREILAAKLAITLDKPNPITDQVAREKVTECIATGQINTIVVVSMDRCSDVIYGYSSERSASSVVNAAGKLAVGNFFRLGIDPNDYRSVKESCQDITVVPEAVLCRLAKRYMREVPSKQTLKYDEKAGIFTVEIQRFLGNTQIGERIIRNIDKTSLTTTADELSELYERFMFRSLQHDKSKKALPVKTAKEIDEILKNGTEEIAYGTDPMTGKVLTAYRGGNGKWFKSKERAIQNLIESKGKLTRQKIVRLQKVVKANIHELGKEALCPDDRRLLDGIKGQGLEGLGNNDLINLLEILERLRSSRQ